MTHVAIAPGLRDRPKRAIARAEPVFSIEKLSVSVPGAARLISLVSDISLSVRPGECVGVVGESGCGKTVTIMSALGLMPRSTQVGGQVHLDGVNLLGAQERVLQTLRGKRIGMIFQDPQSALNPVRTIGEQMAEPMMIHLGLTAAEARSRAVELLTMVGIPAPEARLSAYPHQISGGMCQRVMIAMALGPKPDVLIADEPTTALDATVQLQVLDLIKSIQHETGLAVIIVTHDLGVVARICDRVNVLYAGRLVESRPVPEIFHTPWHPYTKALLNCLPRAGQEAPKPIAGEVPLAGRAPGGCAFHPRCAVAGTGCATEIPASSRLGGPDSLVACHHPHM